MMDPSFFCSEQTYVKSNTREAFFLGMCEVTEHLFSILLNSYLEVLTAVESRSKERAQIGDTSTPSSSAPEERTKKKKKTKVSTLPTSRQSTDKWSQALAKAHATQNVLANVDRKQAGWEEHAEKGLGLLFESVCLLDKFGSKEDWDDDCLKMKVDDVLSKYCPSPFVED